MPNSPFHRAVKQLADDAAKRIAKAVVESGATDEYRRPDGTYDGVRLLADLGGLSEDEVRRIWEEVKRRKRQ